MADVSRSGRRHLARVVAVHVVVLILTGPACRTKKPAALPVSTGTMEAVAKGTPALEPTPMFGELLDPDVLIVLSDAEPMYGDAPLTVRFSVELFDDAVEPRYLWDFGDGSEKSTDPYPVHTYEQPGDYNATVRVTDRDGKTGEDETEVSVFE